MTDASFEGLINEGLAASRENRTHAALDLFARASEVQPSSGIPHFLIGSEHAAAGDMEAAEAALANAALLSPEFALARYQLGLLQFSTGRAAVALVTWQPLLEAAATDSLANFVRGFAGLAQQAFGEALQHFQQGLACADVNPAVAADIRQVLQAVQALNDPQQPAEDVATGHVLLAAYGRGLH